MAQDKQAMILEAAEAVFVERGIAKATVDEITARAGVAKGTFYLYFSSKDEAVRALHNRLWQGHVALAMAAAERLAEAEDWWAEIDRFVEDVVDYDLEHRDWHRLVGQGGGTGVDTGELPEQDMINLVAAAIMIGMERGVCHAADPELTATLLYRAVQGTSHEMCRSDEPPDRDRLVNGFQELARKALSP